MNDVFLKLFQQILEASPSNHREIIKELKISKSSYYKLRNEIQRFSSIDSYPLKQQRSNYYLLETERRHHLTEWFITIWRWSLGTLISEAIAISRSKIKIFTSYFKLTDFRIDSWWQINNQHRRVKLLLFNQIKLFVPAER